MKKKILLSVGMIVFAAAAVIGATGAFFSDTETSTGNTFTAGALDLKVDSEAHYNGMICEADETSNNTGYAWHAGPSFQNLDDNVPADHYPQPGDECVGTWAETDLGVGTKFFDLKDIKPGDEGENTISLHVYDNDAWGRFVISGVQDVDNTCTEPEDEDLDEGCTVLVPEGTTAGSGELAENISFYAWLDQGAIPGFQNIDGNGDPFDADEGEDFAAPDPTEGDNLWQCAGLTAPYLEIPPTGCNEPIVIFPGTVDEQGETHNIWSALAAIDDAYCNGQGVPPTGQNNYNTCHGIADDGRMVGSTTYYFGLAWNVPDDVGNEAQTDSLNADLTFEVEQHRNNPVGFGPEI